MHRIMLDKEIFRLMIKLWKPVMKHLLGFNVQPWCTVQLRLFEIQSHYRVWTDSSVSILVSEEKVGHASFIELLSNPPSIITMGLQPLDGGNTHG